MRCRNGQPADLNLSMRLPTNGVPEATSVQWSGPSIGDYAWDVKTERQALELPYGEQQTSEGRDAMGWMFDRIGRLIVRLQGRAKNREPFTPGDWTGLRDTLRPGDVLLVEGKGRFSGSIKYLTQSTWSHSALYVGPIAGAATDGEPHVLIEANSTKVSCRRRCQNICRVKPASAGRWV